MCFNTPTPVREVKVRPGGSQKRGRPQKLYLIARFWFECVRSSPDCSDTWEGILKAMAGRQRRY